MTAALDLLDWPADLEAREAEIIGEPPPRWPRNAAMDVAEAMFAALGRAERIAADATADWFDPAKFNLIVRLELYRAATRDRRLRAFLPEYRLKARAAVRCYRALRAENRA